MSTNSPIAGHWPDEDQQAPSNHYALSGKIMLASMITLFIVVVFLVLLHLYARWYLLRTHRRQESRHRRHRPPRIIYYIDNNRPPSSPTGGLNPSLLKSLPSFVYSSKTDGHTPECAVCLSEFEDGEKGRVLVNCKHRFHTECIDMWFFNHSTCPLCRAPVEPVGPVEMGTSQVAVLVEPEERLTEPGSSASVNSHVAVEVCETTSDRRKRVDVRIDVPNRNESVPENEFRSPGSRLLSLKRIISMGRKSPVVSPSAGGGPSCVAVATESDRAATESDRESASRGGSIR